MPTVKDILAAKGRDVVSLTDTASVLDAARLMNERGIGGVAVMREGNMVGIFTERDVLRRVVAEHRDPAAMPLRDVMTERVVTCRPEATLDECIAVMTAKRIRHLPVVDDSGLCGMISSGDVLAFQLEDQQATIRYLKGYAFDVGGEG